MPLCIAISSVTISSESATNKQDKKGMRNWNQTHSGYKRLLQIQVHGSTLSSIIFSGTPQF
jgi:hypothetical protein